MAPLMLRFIKKVVPVVLLTSALMLFGCEVHDKSSLLFPRLHQSEVFGFIAGLGTTFAALPDLIKMLRSRSSQGMSPMMAGIMGVFQIVWIYYGLLIASRPVIVWNTLAVFINCFTDRKSTRLNSSHRL